MSNSTALPEQFGRSFVLTLREALSGSADALGDLDRRAGDGDFGTNVRTAMKNLGAEIEEGDPAGYRGWVTAMSRAWLGVGGTSGPLLGMFFRELARAAGAGPEEDPAPTLVQFADALAAGQAVIQKYGEAEVGDKTMIDALDPAVAALREAVEAGKDPRAALEAAEQAAVGAARSTAGTVARRGRASYVGDVAKGVIDPGAAAMALVIGAARAAAEEGGDGGAELAGGAGGDGAAGGAGVDAGWIS